MFSFISSNWRGEPLRDLRDGGAANRRNEDGQGPTLLQRSPDHQPVSVKQVAVSLPATAFREISWREGTDRKLRSRFATVRVRPAHRDYEKAKPHAEEWLLIEWPRGEAEPTRYRMSTLPVDTKFRALIKMAKHRWIIERDYEELKRELGLGHFEGCTWRVASRTLCWRSASDERCAPTRRTTSCCPSPREVLAPCAAVSGSPFVSSAQPLV